jgi:Zn-dependent metalloprotease
MNILLISLQMIYHTKFILSCSGALNEAMSDIFAALVEKFNSQSDDPSNNHANDAVWKIGENVYTPTTPGDALRYMYDPQLASTNKDYYPDRYIGGSDNGGVHWNSGIANLGEYKVR